MKTDAFKDVVARRNQVLWLLLAFQGGFMNAGGFLACHRFVSHVTGYGTYVGVTLAGKDYLDALEMALAPLFFLAGAAYAGWLVDRRLILGREPKLEAGIVTLAGLNLAIYLGEVSGSLGDFGEPLVLQRDFLLLFCLCFACGLQNGLFSGLTGGQVRTTHLTGPATDIGINLAKISALGQDDPDRERLSALNWLRVKIAASFSSGSLIATLVFAQITYEGFAIPCSISLFLVGYVRSRIRSTGRSPRRNRVKSMAAASLATVLLAVVVFRAHVANHPAGPEDEEAGRPRTKARPAAVAKRKTGLRPQIKEAEAHLERLRKEKDELVKEIQALGRVSEES